MKEIPHGTTNGYTNYKCRCDECRAAWSRYMKAYFETPCVKCGKPCWGRYKGGRCRECWYEMQREHLVHGNETGYNRGCRCEECKEAGAAARRRRRHANIEAARAYDREYRRRRVVLKSEEAP